MYLELEYNLAIADLRTKEDVLNYIKDYSVDIPQLDDDGCYFRGNMYDFKKETGMSDEEVVDILFKIEDKDERYIEHTYFTDCGGTRTLELRLGAISYFKGDECYHEPDYPYIVKITKEEFYRIILEKKNSVNAIENILKQFE